MSTFREELLTLLQRAQREEQEVFLKATEEQAKQAYLNSLMKIKDDYDAFYFLASMNLLNKYVKRRDVPNEFINRYIFKSHLLRGIEEIIQNENSSAEVFVDSDVIYITIFNVQFSFHNVFLSKYMRNYKASKANTTQTWKGIRLQKISVELFLICEKIFLHKDPSIREARVENVKVVSQ